jgi:hypothetical protein
VNDYSDVYFKIDSMDSSAETKLIYKPVNENWGPVTFLPIVDKDSNNWELVFLNS